MWFITACTAMALVITAVPTDGLDPARSRAVPAMPRDRLAGAPQLPDGFSDTVVAEVPAPTGLAWTPDRRLVVTSKPGRVTVMHEDGAASPALDISSRVCDDVEQGLVGVTVDPAFETNHFLYFYYTHRVRGGCGQDGPHPANRVSRFVLGDDDIIERASERIILDHIASPEGHHIAGDLEFGADGFLYVSVGDGVCSLVHPTHCGPTNDNAQRRDLTLGKILRITRNGRPPSTNPYANAAGARRCARPAGVRAGTGPCKEIFAIGFRNPFRFVRKPGTNLFYVNDVGMDTWEEVDRLQKGRNYGWNVREGHCRRDSVVDCGPAGRFTNPIHDYRHGDCRSITGGAFVPSVWPGRAGSYLFSDFTCGKIFRLARTPEGQLRRTTFMSGGRGVVDLRFGPYGDQRALYYLSYYTGTVHRVARTVGNTAPEADFLYRPDGLVVAFSGAASSDPDAGDSITSWRWDFGDGTSTTTTTPRTTHTYTTEGPVEVGLTVVDSHGLASTTTSKTVYAGEHPPSLVMTQPAPGARFAVDEAVTLAATATDPEDGPLPGSAITWTVRLRHGHHFHPHLGPLTGGHITTSYPSPENLRAARTSRLVAVATAVDSHGLTTTVRRALLPRTVDITFATTPGGGRLVVQGERLRTPVSVESWVGYVIPVRAPDQTIGGLPYVFRRWSDGGRRGHDLVSPETPTKLVARFRRR